MHVLDMHIKSSMQKVCIFPTLVTNMLHWVSGSSKFFSFWNLEFVLSNKHLIKVRSKSTIFFKFLIIEKFKYISFYLFIMYLYREKQFTICPYELMASLALPIAIANSRHFWFVLNLNNHIILSLIFEYVSANNQQSS